MNRLLGLRSHPVLLLLIPFVVLSIPGLVFSRSLLAGSSDTSLAAARVGPGQPTGSAGPGTARPGAAGSIRSLGTVNGALRLTGPKGATSGLVVFVVDGPKRLVRTDAQAPFAITFKAKELPDGEYTVTVVWTRKGRSSVASTSRVTIKSASAGGTTSSSPTTTASRPAPHPTTTAPRPGSSTTPPGTGGSSALQVLSLTNAQRAKAGCGALRVNAKLAGAAQAHSADMAAHDYFSHNSQDGRSPFDRMTDAGYTYSAAAENIAMGQRTPADVMSAWMGSAGHKANILNCTYTEIGIGYALRGGTPYWTQDFAHPL